MKYYYQILISTADKDYLVFWIRNEEIVYSNPIELNIYVKNNLPGIKEYRKIRNIIVFKINKEHLDDIDRWYVRNSKRRDYRVIED